MTTPTEPAAARDARDRIRTRLIALAAVLLALLVLERARVVALPLVTGLMIAALGWPVQHGLERRLPRPLALLVTVLLVVAVLLVLLGAVGWSFASVGEELARRQDRLTMLHATLTARAARFGLRLPGPAEGEVVGAGTTKRIAAALQGLVGWLTLSVGFAALALAELRDARDKIRRRFAPERAERVLAIAAEVAADVRRYFAVKSLTSLIAGAATGLLALAVGLDFAAVWALLAFIFEYVPTVGSVLAALPPSLYAVVQFGGVGRPLGILAAFTVMQVILGNFVDPRIEGKLLSLSPVVVLLSIIFWGWMWGPPGSLLGVPIAVAATAITRHFGGTRWIWALLTEGNDERTRGGRLRDTTDS